MKRTAVIVVVGLIIGCGVLYTNSAFNFGNTIYEKQTVEVEKIVEVDTLDKMIKDAQNAKSDAIRDAGEQAKREAEEKMLEAIELEVRTAYGKELDAKELELKKKQTSY